MFFSIVTVSYNSGNRLKKTLSSVLSQTFTDYEIIVKDGGSLDGSLEGLPEDDRIKVIIRKDEGIYEAMNEAVGYTRGEYVLFLNCGDCLYDDKVLKKVCDFIVSDGKKKGFYYGDFFYCSRNTAVRYDDVLSDFRLMTRTICHQTIFFSADSFERIKYRPERFRLAADQDLYVRVLKKLGGSGIHMPILISSYEGEGVSDKAEGRKEILAERKEIMRESLTHKEYVRANLLRIISLKAIKEKVSTLSWFHRWYEKLASCCYALSSKQK